MAWYQCDHLGTPQELTDAEGEIVWSAQYKAWGIAKESISAAAQAAGIRNPIRFQGQYMDQETGLHYNRHRYYDPEVGRFISKDPIGFAGGLNVYQYAANPIEWIDPWGLERLRNSLEGERRNLEYGPRLKVERPNAQIQCECYLRDANGKSVRDPKTNERRRVDFVAIENGTAQTYEVTSLTANKDLQSRKEARILEAGGTYIRDRITRKLVPVEGLSILVRIE